MRYEGIVKSWNEERGYGFIEPAQGGQDIFVHITAFPARSLRPQLNQRVSFEVGLNRQGKKRATYVAYVRAPQIIKKLRSSRATEWGGVSLFAIPVFVLLYLALALTWRIPKVVAVAYCAISLVCFMTYAADKYAARAGGRRTKESTLLLLGLLGGWPGALLAQQFMRHKSIKESFRSAFWQTVVVNVVVFAVLGAPQVGGWRWLR